MSDATSELTVGEMIYRREGRPEGYATHMGEYEGKQVIVKQGELKGLQWEKAVLDRIDSVAIPKALALTELGSDARLVLEYMPGTPLDKMVGLDYKWDSQPMPPEQALPIVDSFASRLAEVNQAGFIYRDVFLGHAIVNPDAPKLVSLIDLAGCVGKGPDGTAPAPGDVTWETMSPEEFSKEGALTEATNTYNLGAVLIQLLAGTNPYFIHGDVEPDIKQRREMIRQLHEAPPSSVPFEGEPLGDFLRKALDPDPAKRFATIADFKQALVDLIERQAARRVNETAA
jgi:serine/threonine protein kinase